MSDNDDVSRFGKPRTPVHEDLSAAFGGMVSRIARPDDDATEAATPQEGDRTAKAQTGPTEDAAAQTKPSRPAPRNRAPRASQPTAAPSEHGRADKPVPVSLPVTLLDRLERYRKDTGGSNPSIIFAAIENTYDRLPDLIADRTVNLGGEDVPSLFARSQPAVRRDPDRGPRKQLTIRVTEQNKQVLEDLWVQLGAPNRSVLVETALDVFLP